MSADTLSELLRAVRLRGAIFCYVDGISPWVAEAPQAREITAAILPGAGHLIEDHVVTQGSCWGALTGEAPVALHAGDVIMFSAGRCARDVECTGNACFEARHGLFSFRHVLSNIRTCSRSAVRRWS